MSSNEWPLAEFIEITEYITDYVANGSFASLAQNVNYKEDEDFAVLIRLTDFNNDFKGKFVYVDENAYNFLKKSKLKGGEIIIANVGANAGQVFRAPFLTKPMTLGPNSIMLKTKYDDTFYYYWLKSNNGQEALKSIITGSAQPKFNKTEFRKLLVPLPPITKQIKISSILSCIDDKIENNLATNQTLEEIARTLFKEWFINFNYPNAAGNLKHSEFGEIPENWSINGIGEICYVQNGYAFKSKDFQEQGEVGIIKIKNISGNVVDIQNTDFVDSSVVSSLDKKFKIESGSLLIAMTGAEVGKIGLVPLTEKNLWLNQRVGMFQEKIAFGNLFMYLLLSTATYQTAIQNSALGSAQPNISASAIESIRAIIPPAELIEAFGKTIKPMFEKILDNLAENETLKTTRDSLLPKLMSGEIEVNG
jgi:type I restriction enzyme S subunit